MSRAPSPGRPGHVDLNADLGESFGAWTLGDDEGMLGLVTSANVACGFHAGDPASILDTVTNAARRGVVIGAQVGYPDLVGFGRRFIDISPRDLRASVLYQLGALDGLCRSVGARMAYVKPHGALYNAIVHHEEQAAAVVSAITAFGARLPLVGLPGSAAHDLAEAAGIRTVAEFFADRGYRADGTLVPRSEPGALVLDADLVQHRVARLLTTGQVLATDGTPVAVRAESICVHGDTPDAVALARGVRRAIEAAGWAVSPFVAASAPD